MVHYTAKEGLPIRFKIMDQGQFSSLLQASPKWLAFGVAGLADLARRPHTQPHRTPEALIWHEAPASEFWAEEESVAGGGANDRWIAGETRGLGPATLAAAPGPGRSAGAPGVHGGRAELECGP